MTRALTCPRCRCVRVDGRLEHDALGRVHQAQLRCRACKYEVSAPSRREALRLWRRPRKVLW